MKQKDKGILLAIVALSVVFAWAISNFVLSSPTNLQTEVEVVPAIDATFPFPENTYFNEKSVNPTQLIRIGGNDNENPFPQNAAQ